MKNFTLPQQKKITSLKTECNTFYESIQDNIDELCNTLNFRDASKLSHISDKLDSFIKELNEF